MDASALHQLLSGHRPIRVTFDENVTRAADVAARAQERRRLAAVLRRAQKFEAPWAGMLDDEPLHQTSVEFFRSGALRMPYRECYFEFSRCFGPEPSDALLAGIIIDHGPARIEIHPFLRSDGQWLDLGIRCWSDAMRHPREGLARLAIHDETWQPIVDLNGLRILQYTTTLALFLSTKHAVAVPVEGARDAVSARRTAGGAPPLFSYHRVTVAPDARLSAALGGTHASPRLHWRRGHLRHVGGAPIAVKPCLVGLAERGFVAKEYAAVPAGKAAP